MKKKSFRTPPKKQLRYFGDLSDEELAADRNIESSMMGSMSTRSTLFTHKAKTIPRSQKQIKKDFSKALMCQKKRRIKLFWAKHQYHWRVCEPFWRKKPVMLTKLEFINSLQDKTWFGCT